MWPSPRRGIVGVTHDKTGRVTHRPDTCTTRSWQRGALPILMRIKLPRGWDQSMAAFEKQRDRVEDMMIRKANSSSGGARWELA